MIKVTYLSQTSDTPKVIQCDQLVTTTTKSGNFKLRRDGADIFYGQLSRIITIEADDTNFSDDYEEHLVSRAEGQGD